MMSGIMRMPSKELSRDDFLETYGRTTPRKPAGPTSNETQKECPHIEQKFVIAKNFSNPKNKTPCIECPLNNNNTMTEESDVCIPAIDIDDRQSQPATEIAKERKSIHNIASRLARKSIDMVTRRNSLKLHFASNDNTPSKWNSRLFRRSCSLTPAFEKDPPSLTVLTATTSAPEQNREHGLPLRRLSRSNSHLPITSSPKKKLRDSLKRYGMISPTQQKKGRSKSDNIRDHSKSIYNRRNEYPEMPKTELSSEYEEIRKQEETRYIAVITLLKKRKNSLKLKCSQFEKALRADETVDKDAVKAKLNRMSRKLNVVDQCLSEEREALEVTNAKLELKQKLDHFNFEIRKNLSASSQSFSMSPSTSYDTLPSIDGTSVFDPCLPALSTLSLDHKIADTRTYKKECLRQASAPVTPSSPYPNVNSYLIQKQGKAGRTTSIDCAMTSDCDSGFDNGDSMSRSNISLDRDLSKSAQSLLADNPNYADEKRLPSAFPTSSVFSSQSSLDGRGRAENKKSWNNKDEIDKDVLDQIKEFEIFAEKTLRRLSMKGRLIPLKKDS